MSDAIGQTTPGKTKYVQIRNKSNQPSRDWAPVESERVCQADRLISTQSPQQVC